MAVGGDIIEITFSHPVIGSGILLPKSGESSTYDTGGYRSDDDSNGTDGGGNAIRTMKRVRWSAEATISNDMNTKQEYEKVVKMAGDPQAGTWTLTNINGTVYQGSGFPVGDLKLDTMASTFALKIAGGFNLVKQ